MQHPQPYPPAPLPEIAELEGRIHRIRSEMVAASIDSIVLSDRRNIEYFTGYMTLSWSSDTRPILALLTAEDLIVFASRTEEANVSMRERPFRAVFYNGFLSQLVGALLGEAHTALRSDTAVIGVDFGDDMAGRGSLALLDGLKGNRQDSRIIEAADVIWNVRKIKSSFEAQMKSRSFEIANFAFDRALSAARLGMSEADLYRKIQSNIVLLGAEVVDPFPVIFGNGDFSYNRYPTTRRLNDGDYIWTDFRSKYGGYPADRNRVARGGNPEEWEFATYEKIRKLTLGIAQYIRPGMTGDDVYRYFEEMWEVEQLGEVYARASRIGHGGGLSLTEPPSLMRGSAEVIGEGMILHVEPKLEVQGAVFQTEEAIYVGHDSNTFLTVLSPEELPAVRA